MRIKLSRWRQFCFSAFSTGPLLLHVLVASSRLTGTSCFLTRSSCPDLFDYNSKYHFHYTRPLLSNHYQMVWWFRWLPGFCVATHASLQWPAVWSMWTFFLLCETFSAIIICILTLPALRTPHKLNSSIVIISSSFSFLKRLLTLVHSSSATTSDKT